MSTYTYVVTVLDGLGRTLTAQGEVEAEPGNFRTATDAAIREAFQAVTSGRAVYGQPGEGGCKGPYTIEKFELRRLP